jgi:hypothetical protein
LKTSPIRLNETSSPKANFFRSLRSSELNGLEKLKFDGTFAIDPPAWHGLAPGQAGSAFHWAMTAFNWSLFLISRPMALRDNNGNLAPLAPLTAVLGMKVSAGTPEPNV